MARSITYNSIDFSDADHGLTILRSQRGVLPDVESELMKFAARDGSTSGSSSYKSRFYTLQGLVVGTSQKNLQEKLDLIKFDLDPTKGKQFLQVQGVDDLSGLERGGNALINGPIIASYKGTHSAQIQLNIVVLSGTQKDTADTTIATISLVGAAPDTFDLASATAAVDGTTDPDVVWQFTNTDAVTISGFALTARVGETDQEVLTFTGSIATGDIVRLTSASQYVERNTGAGFVNAMANITDGHPIPTLRAREINACTVTGFVAGDLDVDYRARWL